MPHATTFHAYFTNQTTEEFLQELNQPPFTEEGLSTLDPLTAEEILKNQTDLRSRPIIGIRRIATEGSQTRLGGRIIEGSAGLRITLDGGVRVSIAAKGYLVEYPDGTTARIVTGAGKGYSDIALVGSRLDNGDEIINTPQASALLAIRAGTQRADDFLPEGSDQ